MKLVRDDEFETYVRATRPRLVRTATLLTSGDRHLAEDLVQIALTRLYVAWPRAKITNTDAYVRRVLVNALIDDRRRPMRRREEMRADPPERFADGPSFSADPALVAALAKLPPGMRAAVVLRHVEDLSVEETAAALNCSTGTVKSQTARGLQKLRDTIGAAEPELADHTAKRGPHA